ncbi:DUF885 domain-containing protein [Zunongwangia endophytica]|uniref:DUF885 domain-containing protein n=1 Tax=Zunongwangia endophytica TaxID=1808945 RepID=A0ABV8H7Z4_9FLAO|nr:DUF885 domain-containing protein [Zunongwangia endophytica]MDN3595473.1 DUF885 domain-containing protein [Zunongwangia endophytica]
MKLKFLFCSFCMFLAGICSAQNSSAKLDSILKTESEHRAYDYEEYPLGLHTEALYKSEADFAQNLLDKLSNIDKTSLSQTEKITAELMKFKLQERVDQYEYKAYLNPLLSDAGFHVSLPYHVGYLNNYEQVKRYLNKLNAIPQYVDQNLKLLRKGLKLGITQPLVIFDGYESTYDDQIVNDYKESFYFSPFQELPKTLTQTQKDSVLKAAKIAVEENVIPQFKRIKTFFETEYFPKTRKSIGVSEIPNGREFYQNRIHHYTTLNLTADEVHEIGLKEVARINAEMKAIIEEVEFEGSFDEFIEFLRTDDQFYAETGEELLKEGRNITKKIDAQLPRFFKVLPRKPYGVAPVPSAIAPKYTAGRYKGSSSPTEPGYFWINTYKLKSRPMYALPALALHEAVPGHHLQISLNAELSDSIPPFRRGFYLSAYGEGWGLYAESLGEEMGIYETPYQKFGQLTYEQWRACRLVVDTGMHAKGWSREKAVDFLTKNTALSLHEINTEIDRYISWPGQALSYKMGELKIKELRDKAEKALGTDFDIREFHNVILSQGTVTLTLMEDLVNNYIRSTKDK